MFVSTILVLCYYNGHILRTEIDVKYEGRKAVIVPLDVPIECTFEQLEIGSNLFQYGMTVVCTEC